ncbi:MAG TPA: TetR/AcrR family transcriptional regulator, partial [Planctomycetota bacterium]|nr:TetR/AcrR family transcriptional regulator [Planctomycetota bacterium]
LILRQGYTATTVDQICSEAGLSKGSFFHHYTNKNALGLAAINAWGAMGTQLYSAAWSDPTLDPLVQFDRMLNIMISFTKRDEPCACVIGMMSQELARSHPELAKRCAEHLDDWTQHIARLLDAAKKRRKPVTPFDSQRVGWFLNSVWQGSMLLGKVRQTPQLIVSNLEHARAYVHGLFGEPRARVAAAARSSTRRPLVREPTRKLAS